MSMNDDMISVCEAAARLGVSRKAIGQWVRIGQVRKLREGGHGRGRGMRVSAVDVEREGARLRATLEARLKRMGAG